MVSQEGFTIALGQGRGWSAPGLGPEPPGLGPARDPSLPGHLGSTHTGGPGLPEGPVNHPETRRAAHV